MGNQAPSSPSSDTTNTTNGRDDAKKFDSESRYFDFCSLSRQEMKRLADGTTADRTLATLPASAATPDQVLRVVPMHFLDEIVCMLFLAFGVPNGAFTIPITTWLIGKFWIGSVSNSFKVLALILLPLAVFPQSFVPSTLKSWLAHRIIQYFSFRFAYDERPLTQKQTDGPKEERPQILVAPPHGVFPYGNILSMLVWPSMTGHHFSGLAANAALRVPIFKQILKSIGVVDASRETARKALEDFPHTIGISTGGVAEVFETNKGDECILLKERVGLIKLAIRAGADLVPCYIFGNTKLLSCWSGEGIPYAHPFLEKISRKIGFALIVIHGRFGLPIPFRIPVFGVTGKTIPTAHLQCEEPTDEQIAQIQGQLIDEMQKLFDKYKGMYGWDDKRLIIR
jgi:1-acyl-sn-glycerol-3-phosphate acyltransferase